MKYKAHALAVARLLAGHARAASSERCSLHPMVHVEIVVLVA